MPFNIFGGAGSITEAQNNYVAFEQAALWTISSLILIFITVRTLLVALGF